MFTTTISYFGIGVGIGLMITAGYYAGHTRGSQEKFEDIWAQAQNLQRRLEVAERSSEMIAMRAKARIEYLEDCTLNLQSKIEYYKRQNEGLAEDWKKDRNILIDVVSELNSERQLLKCIDEFLNGIDPDAIEALRKEVR